MPETAFTEITVNDAGRQNREHNKIHTLDRMTHTNLKLTWESTEHPDHALSVKTEAWEVLGGTWCELSRGLLLQLGRTSALLISAQGLLCDCALFSSGARCLFSSPNC